ncbi:serine--tRNA ligase [Methylovulum psychrotolerans]|uniref:Serine--tRNA ligase n=1 Tax=Methylovulum psychrotolerans TaxID=1704499 RepID=A0A1Z4C0R2_9GAMM|nr:serine--tRNA ligase [Methylovulum psychrotolerans]ASF47127.1 serine--tRNA ligase [Methylovulum psychrotolerans]
MLDPRLFRTELALVTEQLQRRHFAFDASAYEALESRRKAIQVKTQELQNERNSRSKAIGQAKAKAKGESVEALMAHVQQLGDDLKAAEVALADVQAAMTALMEGIPNILDEAVPDGKDESANVEISRWGELPSFDFTPKDHVDLGVSKGMEFELGVKIAGSRFVVLNGGLARLQRAIIQLMLDTHSGEHGYSETYVPFLVNADSLYGTGQLPKFAADLFKASDDPALYLIPTAEVPVTNIVRDTIVEAKELPLKFVCHSPCFRSEAGAYGRDVRGMIRQHQFEKVEIVQIVKPEDSAQAHEELTRHAESILQKLNLPYRRMLLCAGDTGFSSSKTYDLEVWLPGQGAYREISSCSNFKDFQARRLQARWRNPETGKPELVHTLNGSGLAAGRTLIAIMENYQDAEGRIHIPEALLPYMGGVTVIG